jgi:dTDP-alpha-D-glucuronic acid decarboxylase
MKTKVMVTGAAGFIGSHLVDRLLAEGNEVYAFDIKPLSQAQNLAQCKNHANLYYFEGDLTHSKDIQDFYVSDAKKLYHFASIVGVEHYLSDPLKLIDIIVGGTRKLLEHAVRHNTYIVYASTSEVYGKNPHIPWSESHDRVLGSTSIDRWSYSTSKSVCEHMLHGLYKQKKLPFTILRYFNAYGPRQEPRYVVSQNVQKALNNETLICYDSGEQTRCFTYVEDIINGIIRATNHPKAIGETFNIGNPVETKINQIIHMIAKLTESDNEIKCLNTKAEFKQSYEDIPRRVPDITKMENYFNWKPTTTLAEGLQETIGWAKSNEWWLEPVMAL